ncbi:type II secretion system protein GspC [Psychromonas algarum]|uniref:type II secretion system protein GspC n=1 Tax=Psychromonas algarum TaxID=2555643 RepID=UPI001FB8D4D2|nr:type II secretion system protein GspC [Psychromonas sp. RZ22]
MLVISQQLPKIVLIISSALVAHQAALLTWSVYPVEDSAYVWNPPARTATNNSSKLSTQQLQNQHLFGEAQAAPKVVQNQTPEDAPKTKLNITLVGIVAASNPNLSSVIIEYRGQQDSYFIDSDITGTNAKVSEIYDDRIIIDVKGEKQTLVLDGLEEANKRMANLEGQQATKSVSSSSRHKTAKIDLDREELLSNPGKLMDYIRISPVREGNAIKGYRVNPGKDPSLFEESGLQAGDLAIELNGVDLTDMGQAMGLMKEFPTMTDISLTVDRDGELNELFFSIP